MSFLGNVINIYSTSPATIFSEIEDCIYEDKSIEYLEEHIIKLNYQLVLKDIKIRYLEKKLEEYSFSHEMWTVFRETFLK